MERGGNHRLPQGRRVPPWASTAATGQAGVGGEGGAPGHGVAEFPTKSYTATTGRGDGGGGEKGEAAASMGVGITQRIGAMRTREEQAGFAHVVICALFVTSRRACRPAFRLCNRASLHRPLA